MSTAVFLAGAIVAAAAAGGDARLPKADDNATRLLAEGDAAAKAGRWRDAARAYHGLLAAAPDAVCGGGDGLCLGARHVGRRRLASLLPEGRAAYRALVDEAATSQLAAARERREADALATLVERYGPWTQSSGAWELVGDLAWERGHARRAQAAYARGLAEAEGGAAEARLCAKRAICLATLGRLVDAHAALRNARGLGAVSVVVGGETVRAAALDAAWLHKVAGVAPEPDVGARSLPQCVWRKPLWRSLPGLARRSMPQPWTPHLPAVDRGLVFLHNGTGVVALDAFSGEAAWRYQPPVERRIGLTLVYGAAGGGPLEVAVGAHHVYASFVQPTGKASPLHSRRRIHAIDLASGRVRYVLGLPSEASPLLGRLCFCTTPAERDGVLYAAAFDDSGFCGYYLLAFDAASGRLLWSRYVFSADAPRTLYLGPGHSAPLVVADGSLIFASNSGAVACVDADSGELRWARRYPRTGGFWVTKGGKPIHRWPGWRNPPLVDGGRVLVAPCDAETMLFIDVATGDVRWQRPRAHHVFVHGAERGAAVLGGRGLEAIGLATGRSLWRRAVESRGRGTVSGGAVHCPTPRGLLALDLETGRVRGLHEAPGGHIVSADGFTLVVGKHELSAHCDATFIAARARRRIAADPVALEPRYRLASGLWLAGEAEGAARALGAALRLCTGRRDALAIRVRALAWRVFSALAAQAEQQDKPGAAANFHRQAADAADDPVSRVRATLGTARCLRAQSDWPGLARLYQGLIDHEPDVLYPLTDDRSVAVSVLAERRLARVLQERGRDLYEPFERAAAALEGREPLAVARRYPNSLTARRALADAARRATRPDVAARHYAALLRRLEPGSREARQVALRLVECCEQSGDIDAARAILEQHPGEAATARLRGPHYSTALPDPEAPALCTLAAPAAHAWTSRQAGLTPLVLKGAHGAELAEVVLARDPATLYGLDAATGQIRWQTAVAEAARGEASASARLHRGLLVVYGGRYLYALDPRDGRVRWPCDLGPGRTHQERRLDWWGRLDHREASFPSHVFAGGRIFVAALDGTVACLDAATGERIWETALPAEPVTPLHRLGDRLAIGIGPALRVAWLDAGTGRLLEAVRLRKHPPGLVPTWAGGLLAVLDGCRADGLDARTGERRWSVTAAKAGKAALERFGSRLVLISTGGSLTEVDASTGAVVAERETGPIDTYLRSRSDLFLFCRRSFGRERRLSVEAYRADGLGHLWFASLPSDRVFDASATQRLVLISLRAETRGGKSVRDVLLLDRRSGARLGVLDIERFRPYALSTFASWPRHLLATVQCEVDAVAAPRLVAFGAGPGPRPLAPQPDRTLEDLREGRITAEGMASLALRHAERGAFAEARALLDRAAARRDLSDTDYLRVGDATASVRRRALGAWRPEKAIYGLDLALPEPLRLDRFRHLEVAEARAGQPAARWRGPEDLSARVHLAHAPGALCVYAVVRDDAHHPGREGDRLELAAAPWQARRRQWGDGDLRLAVWGQPAAMWRDGGGRVPEAVRCAVSRDEGRRLTTYWLLIPWRVIGGFKAKPGALVDFALAVHDADGRGAKAAARWGLPEPGLTGRLLIR